MKILKMGSSAKYLTMSMKFMNSGVKQKERRILTDGMLLFRCCLSSVLTATLSLLMLNCWQYWSVT